MEVVHRVCLLQMVQAGEEAPHSVWAEPCLGSAQLAAWPMSMLQLYPRQRKSDRRCPLCSRQDRSLTSSSLLQGWHASCKQTSQLLGGPVRARDSGRGGRATFTPSS